MQTQRCTGEDLWLGYPSAKQQVVDPRVGLLEAVVPGLGCCAMAEPFLELIEGQERLCWRKWIFKRVVRGKQRDLAGRKGAVVLALGISSL